LKATGPCFGVIALLASLVGGMGPLFFAGAGMAGEPLERAYGSHPARHHYRRAPAVRGYVLERRVGGYSYGQEEIINTYGGLGRNLFGPFSDRQTPGGPFDSGFFFDSGVAPRGGESPYLH